MAAYFSGAGAQVSAASGNVTPALPTGLAVNDIMFLVVTTGDNVASDPGANWTSLYETNNGTTHRHSIFWRRAVAGDTAPTVTHTAGTTILARIYGFRGAITTGSPINASSNKVNASSVTITADTITPKMGELVLFIASISNGDTSIAMTFSAFGSGTNPTFNYNGGTDEANAGTTENGQFVSFGSSSDGSATGTRTATAGAAGTNFGSLYSLISAPSSAPVFQDRGLEQSGIGNITVAWPPHLPDDVALLFIESAGGQVANLGTPAGFVAVSNSPQATGVTTAGTQLTIYWCRATSSSQASPIVTDPGDHAYGFIMTFRGCRTGSSNPWDITAGSVKAGASTTTTWDSVTTTLANCLILFAASRDTDSAAAAWSAFAGGNCTNLGELHDSGTTQGNGGGIVVNMGILAVPGASGAPTATVASSINAEMTLSLPPGNSGLPNNYQFANSSSAGILQVTEKIR